jgi:hypothetical protein
VAAAIDALRLARPPQLLLVCDGPRNEAEEKKVRSCRELAEAIDWPCEVVRDYSDVNLGCRARIQSGLDHAFHLYDRCIILEDDVQPHDTFFTFCDEMLERYADDTRIMTVTGGHYLKARLKQPDSYYFSPFASAWGWASWRRAWLLYDREMQDWPRLRGSMWLFHHLQNVEAAVHFTRAFDAVRAGKIDTWDYQLSYSIWVHHGLNVVPSVNLCQNAGFRADATHTVRPQDRPEATVEAMEFPLRHPRLMISSPGASEHYLRERLPSIGPFL